MYKLTLDNGMDSKLPFTFYDTYEMEAFMEKALQHAEGNMVAKIQLKKGEEKEDGSEQ